MMEPITITLAAALAGAPLGAEAADNLETNLSGVSFEIDQSQSDEAHADNASNQAPAPQEEASDGENVSVTSEAEGDEAALLKQQQRAQNPFSDIQGIEVDYNHRTSLNGFGGEDIEFSTFRYFQSFKIGEGDYIARVVQPYAYDLPGGGDGFGDLSFAAGKTHETSWGLWGVGFQGTLPTGNNEFTNDVYRLGPLVGAIVLDGSYVGGVINFNEFTLADENDADPVNISQLQFFSSYHLGNGFSVGLSEMILQYNWEEKEFDRIPLGAALSQLLPIGDVAVARAEVSYEHNFFNGFGGESDTVRLRVTLFRR